MPRAAKVRGGGAPQKAGAKKKNGYVKSEEIPLGEILTDLARQQWKIGPVIGSGGFGDIYCARKVAASSARKKDSDDYDCVIKIEPHGNGPLFVEMHFYMRSAKLEDIKEFCAKKKFSSLGMPYMIGSGSHVLKGEKHRFLVMPRYGKDVWNYFLANEKRLPQHTVYRLAIQMLNVYEYIHGSGYVHADLKGANILMEYPSGKNAAQAYLVDFGLAGHYTTKDYKPDPRKMHNGTIEYTSRDAHNGVPTMRGDMEILGYNLIHWSGVELPWETANLLANPAKVQKSKEDFIKDVSDALSKLFQKNTPAPIKQFMEYVQSMEYNETPDYEKCRKYFLAGLKSLNKSNSGPLELTFDSKSPAKKAAKRPANVSPPDRQNTTPLATPPKRKSPRSSGDATESKRTKHVSPARSSPAPGSARKRAANSPSKLNITPSLVSSTVSAIRKPGKTIVNDNVTPVPKSDKTYEFNFELDVSLDANVIVNVKRKKKAASASASKRPYESKENANENTIVSDTEIPASPDDSPVPRVHVRKLRTTTKTRSPAASSPKVTTRRVK